jgi:hypothetical protein
LTPEGGKKACAPAGSEEEMKRGVEDGAAMFEHVIIEFIHSRGFGRIEVFDSLNEIFQREGERGRGLEKGVPGGGEGGGEGGQFATESRGAVLMEGGGGGTDGSIILRKIVEAFVQRGRGRMSDGVVDAIVDDGGRRDSATERSIDRFGERRRVVQEHGGLLVLPFLCFKLLDAGREESFFGFPVLICCEIFSRRRRRRSDGETGLCAILPLDLAEGVVSLFLVCAKEQEFDEVCVVIFRGGRKEKFLFNVGLSDLEKSVREVRVGGVKKMLGGLLACAQSVCDDGGRSEERGVESEPRGERDSEGGCICFPLRGSERAAAP